MDDMPPAGEMNWKEKLASGAAILLLAALILTARIIMRQQRERERERAMDYKSSPVYQQIMENLDTASNDLPRAKAPNPPSSAKHGLPSSPDTKHSEVK